MVVSAVLRLLNFDPRWLDLVTGPGQPAIRVGLGPPARPPHDATVTAGPVTASPGDHVLHASGPMNQVSYSPAELCYWPVTWIRDSGGRWHATRTLGRGASAGESALRVEVVPPLSRTTTGIEVIATGRSAEAPRSLPLRRE